MAAAIRRASSGDRARAASRPLKSKTERSSLVHGRTANASVGLSYEKRAPQRRARLPRVICSGRRFRIAGLPAGKPERERWREDCSLDRSEVLMRKLSLTL